MYEAYSKRKYRFQSFPPQRWGRYFANARCLPSFIGNTKKADSVYVLLCVFKMFKMIERPADCKVRSVIRFLNTRNVKPADTHRQVCEVYGENAMSDGMVRKWIRKFNEGRDNVHGEPRNGRPSVMIWCAPSKQEFVKTDGSPFRRCPCISSKFQEMFSAKFWQTVWTSGNCAHARCRRSSSRNTKRSGLPVRWSFSRDTVSKVMCYSGKSS